MTQIQNITNITGWWTKSGDSPKTGEKALNRAILDLSRPIFLMNLDGQKAVANSGIMTLGALKASEDDALPLLAYVPALLPDNLGDPDFKKRHNLRYPYIAGAMANGITSVEMVEKVGLSGMIGFFGAAGLSLDAIESSIDRLQNVKTPFSYGANLIYSPNDPELEMATVNLYIKRGVSCISASAFMDMTLALVYYRVKGIHKDNQGAIICPNSIIAKISRIEVARKFLSPPPEKLLRQLIAQNLITDQEASLASSIPMAYDITAEADSGGHTDNRPAMTLLPTILALRDEMASKYRYKEPVCIGLAGGIATPDSAAAAFAMGASYILTGSVNQACVESGTSNIVKNMLAVARQADVTMAPAADMFELGVKVQVLKRGTLFPFRAAKLYELYLRNDSIESIPEAEKKRLEDIFFHQSLEAEWEGVKQFFEKRDPEQIDKAKNDSKHKMALIFRSYLGKSSMWAIKGEPDRKIDYQIWCGPALASFNEWVKGTFLSNPENRKTVTVALNLLLGAAFKTRVAWLQSQGIRLSPEIGRFNPMEYHEMQDILNPELKEFT